MLELQIYQAFKQTLAFLLIVAESLAWCLINDFCSKFITFILNFLIKFPILGSYFFGLFFTLIIYPSAHYLLTRSIGLNNFTKLFSNAKLNFAPFQGNLFVAYPRLWIFEVKLQLQIFNLWKFCHYLAGIFWIGKRSTWRFLILPEGTHRSQFCI